MVRRIRSGILDMGIFSVGRTDLDDIRNLIKRLRPQDCDKDLIRVGGSGDGGYLIPDDLDGIQYCFSPGVNTSSSFESELAQRGIRSFLADFSVDGPALQRPEFVFDKKFLGATDRGCYMTLQSWKDKYIPDHRGDLILQMDIEGSEYEVIFNTPDKLLDQFRIIAIEFHYLDRLFDPATFLMLQSCFDKLLTYFDVVHIHPNNCCGGVATKDIEVPTMMEFTFINKRRVVSRKPQLVFPHRLDVDNTGEKTFPLPRCWYDPASPPSIAGHP